jgi:hypothetical protein
MLTSLFATSDFARRVAERSLEMGSITFSYPKKPIDLHAQSVCDTLKFVIKDMAVVIFDFGDCGSVELNSQTGEPA